MAGVSYLHGIEFLPVAAGVRPVSVVRASVIALTGIAPKGDVNKLVLVQKSSDLAQFGSELPGFTIPQALAAIFANQPTQVLVVNLFDPATHVVAVVKETVTISDGKGKLAYPQIGALTSIYQSDGTTVIAAVVDEDYTIDDFGNITVLDSVLIPDGDIKISYKKANIAGVTTSDLIGTDGDTRTGMQLFRNSYATFGFKPKIIITPGYSSVQAIANEMAAMASRYKAIYLLDAPAATAMSDIQTSRGPAGPVDTFNTSDLRAGLLYPMPTAYDAYTDSNDQVRPFSSFLAGLIAFVDATEGYHVSPSNHVIKGITGIEMPISFDPTDQTGTTDANDLNSRGIITIGNTYGTGFLAWGNSSAGFPSVASPDRFLCVQRTRDVVEESIAFAMIPYADKPLSQADIDFVLETVNAFIRQLIARKALIEGSNLILDPEENTSETLAAGQVVYFLDIMSPPPAERQTFKVRLNTKLLSNVLAGH